MKNEGRPKAGSRSKRNKAYVGVISDTHGLLRPELHAIFRGVHVIIHAGDVGGLDVIHQLRDVAPVRAVRGNVDKGRWAEDFPVTDAVEVDGALFYVVHEIAALDLDPEAAGVAAVISGHSHRSSIEFRNGVLYLNPGSAGPRRFKLPVTVARVEVSGNHLRPEIIELAV
jgi:putative phosphoesterase